MVGCRPQLPMRWSHINDACLSSNQCIVKIQFSNGKGCYKISMSVAFRSSQTTEERETSGKDTSSSRPWLTPPSRRYRRWNSDQEHQTRPLLSLPSEEKKVEDEIALAPSENATFKLTIPEDLNWKVKVNWGSKAQNNRSSLWGLTEQSLPTNWGFGDQKWPRIIREPP